MAYVPSNPDDDEEQRRASASNAPGSFGDTTPTSAPTKTNFVNVGDYLSKNPEASTHLGDLASGKLTEQRDDAQNSLNSAKTGFGEQVESGTTKLDQGFLNSAFESPETFAQNPGDMAKFAALKDASYKGPDSLQSSNMFAPTQSKVTALNQVGQGLGTEAGRTKLVEGLSSHPTAGKSSLNQLLLQGNPAAAQKISDTAGTFKSVDDQWNDFMASTPAMVNQAKAQTNDARTATRSGLDTATQAFMNQLNTQTSKATSERDAFNAKYQGLESKISSDPTGLSQGQLTDLGIPDAYPYLDKLQRFNGPNALGYYGQQVQLSNYMTPGQLNSNVPTMANTASPEQYARESALQQMAGYDLGLPDQQAAPYQANGQLPILHYMEAFNKAGTDLKAADAAWQPKVAGYGPDDLAMLASVQGRTGAADYYTNPSTAAAAPSDGHVGEPAPGDPYPTPTSPNPYGSRGAWDSKTGQWFQIGLV